MLKAFFTFINTPLAVQLNLRVSIWLCFKKEHSDVLHIVRKFEHGKETSCWEFPRWQISSNLLLYFLFSYDKYFQILKIINIKLCCVKLPMVCTHIVRDFSQTPQLSLPAWAIREQHGKCVTDLNQNRTLIKIEELKRNRIELCSEP